MRDITGKRFGRLTVLRFVGKNKYGSPKWACLCDCGKETTAYTGHLNGGSKKSCGCMTREVGRKNAHLMLRHGKTLTNEYSIWQAMRQRCKNKSSPTYYRYGGRGIKLCARWEDFSTFLEDMGHRPKGHSIERIDNNKGYFPSNCRWATPVDQQNNRRNNIVIELGGQRMTMKQWATEKGICYSTVMRRRRAGWPPERLFDPAKARAAKKG